MTSELAKKTSGNLLCNFTGIWVRKTQTAFDSDRIKITKYVCETPIYLTSSGEASLVFGFNVILVILCLFLNVLWLCSGLLWTLKQEKIWAQLAGASYGEAIK